MLRATSRETCIGLMLPILVIPDEVPDLQSIFLLQGGGSPWTQSRSAMVGMSSTALQHCGEQCPLTSQICKRCDRTFALLPTELCPTIKCPYLASVVSRNMDLASQHKWNVDLCSIRAVHSLQSRLLHAVHPALQQQCTPCSTVSDRPVHFPRPLHVHFLHPCCSMPTWILPLWRLDSGRTFADLLIVGACTHA